MDIVETIIFAFAIIGAITSTLFLIALGKAVAEFVKEWYEERKGIKTIEEKLIELGVHRLGFEIMRGRFWEYPQLKYDSIDEIYWFNADTRGHIKQVKKKLSQLEEKISGHFRIRNIGLTVELIPEKEVDSDEAS